MTDVVLKVKDLAVSFMSELGLVRAVDGVDFELRRGETLALVGESGCGKSVTAHSILRLVEHAGGRIERGSVWFNGADLLKMPAEALRRVRGNRIAMIFQEPMTALNPVFTVGEQVAEVIREHLGRKRKEARAQAIDLFARVGIPDPSQRVDHYPHQLSGGMKQRVMIAMALACSPLVLIADEPTTALDVTVQAQILDLIASLQREQGMAVLLITHDLGVVAEVGDRVSVMYCGRMVEHGTAHEVFSEPLHPYTHGLISSIPSLTAPRGQLRAIPGGVPDPLDFPSGCRFHPRCFLKTRLETAAESGGSRICSEVSPSLREWRPSHPAACHFAEHMPPAAKEPAP